MTAPSNNNTAPVLRTYLNLDNLTKLRSDSLFPSSLLNNVQARDARLLKDGFEGVQVTSDPSISLEKTDLPFCGLARINQPTEADAIARQHAERGDECITVHVGWGIEDDDDVARLVEAVLSASQRHHLPIFIETHRATITQDMWRTVQITKRFPEVRFNIDLSHYYCGQEMVYGDWSQKLEFLQPIFDRTGFIHGRIAAPGWMQATIEDASSKPRFAVGTDYLAHFREMWTLAMAGFLRHAKPGAALVFAPELLCADFYYARVFPNDSGSLEEESDRYAQALLYNEIARECWKQAQL